MALSFYNTVAEDLVDAGWDWVADTIHIMILTNAYTFSAAHDFENDLTASEVATGNGYTTGGLALAGKTASLANPCVLSANDVVIAQNGAGFINGRKYALKKQIGAASANPLLCYGTAAADFGNVAGALTLDVPASFITVTA